MKEIAARLLRLRSLALVLAALALSAGARPASAHATLVTATLKPGAVLTTLPATITATFAEGVNPKGSFIGVFEATGDHGEVDRENAAVSFKNAKQIIVGLPKKLSKGLYAFIWYTVSADDGHRAAGSFTFTVK